MNHWIATFYKQRREFKERKNIQVPTCWMYPSSLLQIVVYQCKHIAWNFSFSLSHGLKSCQHRFVIHHPSWCNVFHRVNGRYYQKSVCGSLLSQCQLKSILMQFLTFGWGLGFFFSLSVSTLSHFISGQSPRNSFSNSQLICHSGWAISSTKILGINGYIEVDTKLTYGWTLLC